MEMHSLVTVGLVLELSEIALLANIQVRISKNITISVMAVVQVEDVPQLLVHRQALPRVELFFRNE